MVKKLMIMQIVSANGHWNLFMRLPDLIGEYDLIRVQTCKSHRDFHRNVGHMSVCPHTGTEPLKQSEWMRWG